MDRFAPPPKPPRNMIQQDPLAEPPKPHELSAREVAQEIQDIKRRLIRLEALLPHNNR